MSRLLELLITEDEGETLEEACHTYRRELLRDHDGVLEPGSPECRAYDQAGSVGEALRAAVDRNPLAPTGPPPGRPRRPRRKR